MSKQIDEKRLDEWSTWLRDQPACTIDEIEGFIRLARLGLWAEKHGIEALLEIREENERFAESAVMDWYGVQDIASKALAALPKQGDS